MRDSHYPYRPAFQEEDICPFCTRYPSDIVVWPCPSERLFQIERRCEDIENSTNAHDEPMMPVAELRALLGDMETVR
jgi:hypothetical protein